MVRYLIVGVVIIFYSLSTKSATDSPHVLITPYKGVESIKSSVTKYGNYSLIIGFDFMEKTPNGMDISGTLTRMYHDNPKGRSILEIYDNYKDSLIKAGATVLWQCHGDDSCFTSSTRNTYKQFNGIQAINGGDSRYFAGKLTIDKVDYHIAVAVGRKGTSIDIVESSSMDKNMVKINTESLLNSLKIFGSVKVDGLYFAHDESQLLPESTSSMSVLAQLLRENPGLTIFVVGHTDLTGDLEYNFNLSKKRAEAVIEQLVSHYSIAPERLMGFGIGPLAPKSSNATDKGQATNRRVEVVVKSW